MVVFKKINKLFGTDGIRGKPPQYPLDKKTVTHLGYWAGRILLQHYPGYLPVVLLGSDTRASGDFLKKYFSQGLLLSPGLKLIDTGVIPTAAVSYLVRKKKFLFGVVISASHNPAAENGIKLIGSSGEKLPEKIEEEIEKNIFRNIPRLKNYPLNIEKQNFSPEYRDFLLSTVEKDIGWEKLSLVVDVANGAAFQVAEEVFQNLGVNLTLVNNKPDGYNINKDCGALHPENISELCRQKKSFGLTLDGDADRAIILDKEGKIYDGDYLLYLVASYFKRYNQLKSNTVVTTTMANLGFLQAMKRKKIRVMVTPVGDRWVAREMKRSRAILGGEQSGHIIFRQFLPTGDGLLTALKVFQIILKEKLALPLLVRGMKKYPQKIFNVRVKEKIPVENLPEFQKELEATRRKLQENGRIVVRYSGTENYLRIMVEAKDIQTVEKIGQRLGQIAETYLS